MYFALLGLGALDAAAYSVIAPVVPAIGDATGAGPGLIGALVGIFAIGMAVGFVLAGGGVQRRHAGAVLGAAVVLMGVGSLGFALTESLAVYFVARFLMGVGSGGLWIGCVFGVLERFPGEEYRRLTGLLGMYSVGGVAGPALGVVGGIRGPFLAYFGLVVLGAVAVALIGAPRDRPAFGSDRAMLRSPGFALASSSILLVALTLGTLEGPLPLHFATLLEQAEISALYVGTAFVVGGSATVAGRWLGSRVALGAGTVLLTLGVALLGLTESVPAWILALAIAALGFGLGEAGSMGVLLDTVGTERIVLAMVVWSQLWAIGYLAGPAAGGGVAEWLGFGWIGIVPLVVALGVAVTFVWGGRSHEVVTSAGYAGLNTQSESRR